jgi:hypothetical protein
VTFGCVRWDDLAVSDPGENYVCRRCGRPVRTSRDYFEVFEGMHYVCFHYEFEHDMADPQTDPDDDCGVSGCPSAPAARHKDRLVAAVRELSADWSDGAPANWHNRTLPDYLDGLAGWLRDCDGYYANRGLRLPWDGWQVVTDAMRAATTYE